jgi:hypothetical protein
VTKLSIADDWISDTTLADIHHNICPLSVRLLNENLGRYEFGCATLKLPSKHDVIYVRCAFAQTQRAVPSLTGALTSILAGSR